MAHNYKLESCNEAEYPSLEGYCHDSEIRASLLNKMFRFNNNTIRWYKFVYVGENTSLCTKTVNEDIFGQGTLSNFTQCSEVARDRFETRNCKTSQTKILEFDNGVIKATNAPCENCTNGFSWNRACGQCERITKTRVTYDFTKTAYPLQASNALGILLLVNKDLIGIDNLNDRGIPIRRYTAEQSVTALNNILAADVLRSVNLGLWQGTSTRRPRGRTIKAPIEQWTGVSKYFNEATTKDYLVALGTDALQRLKINGKIIYNNLVSSLSSNASGTYKIITVRLCAGENVMSIEGKKHINTAGEIFESIFFEVYDATINELESKNTHADIDAITVFSSAQLLATPSQRWHYGEGSRIDLPTDAETSIYDDGVNDFDLVQIKIERNSLAVPCTYGSLTTAESPCDCMDIIRKENVLAGEYSTLKKAFASCSDCDGDVGHCSISERTISVAVSVKMPQVSTPDVGVKECCYRNIVLGHKTDDSDYKNDYTGFYFKRETPNDTCSFILKRLSDNRSYGLSDNTYGEYKDFGGYEKQQDLKTYIIEWQKVLKILGSGAYLIEKNITVAGVSVTQTSNTYYVEEYTKDIADKTVRLDSVMNGELVHLDVDFKDTDFRTSLRTKGYFGNRNPKYTQDNIVKRNYDIEQITMSQENEYEYQTGLLPSCITEELYDYILFSNELYINDYNLKNHSNKFIKLAVELSSNKGAKYYPNQKHSLVSLVFKNRIKNIRKINC